MDKLPTSTGVHAGFHPSKVFCHVVFEPNKIHLDSFRTALGRGEQRFPLATLHHGRGLKQRTAGS